MLNSAKTPPLVLFLSIAVACAACGKNEAPADPQPCQPPCPPNAYAWRANQVDGSLANPNGDAGSDGVVDAGPVDASPDLVPDAGPVDASPDLVPDAGPVDCTVQPSIEVQDGIDNDCDQLTDELEVCAIGGQYATIGSAIAAATTGATVEVCAGTYPENLTIDKRVRIIAPAGAGSTFLDATSSGRAVTLSGIGGSGLEVDGLTIRNGSTPGRGGAVYCTGSTLRLERSVIRNSDADEGGGLYAADCSLQIIDTNFADNTAHERGGGALVIDSTGSIQSSTFANNEATYGGGLCSLGGDFSIDLCSFTANSAQLQGGGLHYRGDATIQRTAFDGNDSNWIGGGIYIDREAPLLDAVDVSQNSSVNDGGGIYLFQSAAVISNSIFEANYSGDDGGGIRIFEGSNRVENNLVNNNYAADSGGGIRISHLPAEFINNQVTDNSAFGVGGGYDLDNCSSVITGGSIVGNSAGGSGGGIHAWLFPWFGGSISGVRIADNSAWRGGGIYIEHNFQKITLRDLDVEGNTAATGAGIFIRTSEFELRNSSFRNNTAQTNGGALSIGADGSDYSDPCPCPATAATGIIQFATVYDNQADGGGSGLWASSPSLLVNSTIFAANLGDAVEVEGTSPGWEYNDVFPATFVGMNDPTGVAGNVAIDPLFVNASTGDYALQPGSACVDAGDPEFLDLDGSRADMGLFGGLGGTL